MRWTNEQRFNALPEPTIIPIANGETWKVTLDFFSASNSEADDLLLSGFGSTVRLDYYRVAKKKTLDFIKERGWRLSRDQSTIAGVEFVCFKPSDSALKSAPPRLEAHHGLQQSNAPCIYCNTLNPTGQCPSVLEAMGFTLPPQILEQKPQTQS